MNNNISIAPVVGGYILTFYKLSTNDVTQEVYVSQRKLMQRVKELLEAEKKSESE